MATERGWILALLATAALLVGCGGHPAASLPDLADPPKVETVGVDAFQATVPATGVAQDDGFEVTLGSDDAGKVRTGARAWVQIDGRPEPAAATVERVLAEAAGGGQGLAWLVAATPVSAAAGAFVSADIAVGPRRMAASVPVSAVYVSGGRSVVLVAAKGKDGVEIYAPASVETGVRQGGRAEILSGLKPGQRIVTAAGIGFLYPDFKAQAAN